MIDRSQALAAQFAAANDAVIAFVEQCDDARWQAPSAEDGRPVSTVIDHIALAYLFQQALLQALLDGQPLPGPLAGTERDSDASWAAINQANAEHAAHATNTTRAAAVQLLRERGQVVQAFISGLSAEELKRQVLFPYNQTLLPVQVIIKIMVIGHVKDHLASVQGA